jgi:predicted small lipoprotein YifL
MKRALLLILLASGLAACGPKGSTNGPLSGGDANQKAESAKPKIGETAVYKFSPQGYVEGKVEKIEGSRYEFKYGTSIEKVDSVDVHPLPAAGAKADVKAGDIVVAFSHDTYWAGSTVKSVTDDVVEVENLDDGKVSSVAHEKVVKVSPAAAAEFKRYGEKKAFIKTASSKRLVVPAGYKPKAGEKVVAQWGSESWYPGVVKSVTGDDALIDWPSFPDSTISIDRVAPFPKAEGAIMPKANDFILVRPDNESFNWDFAQVTSVSGQEMEVKLADGKTKTVKAGNFVSLS